MTEVYIVAAKRTAIGNFNGSLATVPAHKLGEVVIRQVIQDAKLEANEVCEVIMGQVLNAACGQNPVRQASMSANIPKEVPAWGVSQVCGSGLKSVALGFQAIKAGDSKIVIAGGQENMSLSPHAIHLRGGVRMGDANFTDTMIKDGLWDIFNDYHMGITAENVAKEFSISRQDQDSLALGSQNKAEEAQKNGKFKDEIVPVTIKSKKGDIVVDQDEFIKAGTTIENLAKLKPAFKGDGTVTAGNASGINDGAACVVLMTKEEAEKRGLKPLAKIVSWAQAGVDPAIMGIGPVCASKKALEKAGWKKEDLDLIEANEAFAAQAEAVNKEMAWDKNKVNVNGGAIAIGHPIGASGARILVTLLHEMQRRNAKKAIATLCIGGGMGIAMCLER